ncbi:DUF2865 domain-containing protein [Bradyrhizobium sp.]|uniref:DUF2865 domain-containing protein n=1 Tax=Bradyrhizobium sp. TaxID=376 RepID=UPI002602ED29|nr:DUF2865 domain-containing protein [Bradyrhizobium sp.]
MPDSLMITPSRSVVACATLLAAVLFGSYAHAQAYPPQSYPPPPPPPSGAANPMCPRLEAQLATIDRGGFDPARDEQIRRYQDSAAKQQAELDRITLQAKRMGCDSSGFLSLFTGQNAQCGPVNNQIQQMRANLDQITTNLENLRTGGLGGGDRENQRHSVLLALAQNNCGPQYATALQQQQGPGGFLNNLFGNGQGTPNATPIDPMATGTYRTVCVRTCDGGYFPISFATIPARFPDDEKSCKALCPATEANLYAYRNPGEDISQAVSISGQPYTALPNAFHFRQEFNPTCSCRAPGQSWADALKGIDDKAAAEQQGDIIVTEESAKKMSRPLTKPTPASRRGSAAATPPATRNPPAAVSDASPDSKTIRTVGPTFIPAH